MTSLASLFEQRETSTFFVTMTLSSIRSKRWLPVLLWLLFGPLFLPGFVLKSKRYRLLTQQHARAGSALDSPPSDVRRHILAGSAAILSVLASPRPSHAALGSLPELADTNAILQGIIINVADKSQLDAMISLLSEAFGFEVLRKRIRNSVDETWLGFGPEQLSIPSDFTPVSSFAKYGGHSSIHIVYDAKAKTPFYQPGDAAPGNNIAYLQVAVPGYRISKMTSNGGNILDAYGLIDVVTPAGLPIRGIVGIAPDPIMLVAVNCNNVDASKAFYQQLGFVERPMPYSRPSNGTTVFEPAPPPNSVYMAPTANGMGILLLPTKQRVTRNLAIDSLRIVYAPPSNEDADTLLVDSLVDPSGVAISFQSVKQFEKEEKETR